MLIESGDLIPVIPEAVEIPWTKRKSEVLNFLHRGWVTFATYVYDTNVGDIAPLSTYFNPNVWTVIDLNKRFGQCVDNIGDPRISSLTSSGDTKSDSLQPKLLIYPQIIKPLNQDQSQNQEKNVSPTRMWNVLSPLISSPNNSQLPSPPTKILINDENGSISHDDKPQPIAPPKRRKMSLNFDATSCSKMRCLGLSGFVSKSASTSSPWTTNMKSPFLSFDPTWGKYDDVFNTGKFVEKDSIEEPKEIRDDEEYLARSLRKIAKEFEPKEFEPKKCDQCNMTKV